jgi:hypothetical protein
MDDTIVSPHLSGARPQEPLGQAESLPTPLDARTTLQYDPITQDRHIRVLDLAPGSWDEPVTCSLSAVHLDDDDLRYEAISYAWGDPADRKTVICNGRLVSTTRSLFEALQRFRMTGTTRTLWADALCINQADNDERTSQVRLMSFIYTKAVRVLVWLQHDDDEVVREGLNAICRYLLEEDDFARPELKELRARQHNSQILYQWRDVAVTSVTGEDSVQVTVAAMDALQCICSSTWFGRGWVIQETALGTSVSVFWGHAEIDFELLGIASWSNVTNITNYPPGINRGVLNCFNLSLLSPSHTSAYKTRSCFDLIAKTILFTFTEPKDRIYGILGLKTLEYDPVHGQLLVNPDYNITTMECYRRVAGRLLSEWHDLRVLSWAGNSTGLAANWPSWVPNWEAKAISSFGAWTDVAWRTIGKSSLTEISETMNSGEHCIEISGFRVDAVGQEVKEYVDLGLAESDTEAATHLQAVLRTLELQYGDEYLACTFGNWFRYLPLSSVRIANLLDQYHMFMERDSTRAVNRPMMAEQFDDDSVPSFIPSADRLLYECKDGLHGYTVLITSTGMLGLGPKAWLPGDVVVVLHGASLPFVLRPADYGLWRLVGECYLYDVTFIENGKRKAAYRRSFVSTDSPKPHTWNDQTLLQSYRQYRVQLLAYHSITRNHTGC